MKIGKNLCDVLLQLISELLQICFRMFEQDFGFSGVQARCLRYQVKDFGEVDVLFEPPKAHRSVPGRFKDARRRNRIERS